MARTHTITPLDVNHLRALATVMRRIGDAYDDVANQLGESKATERVFAEKYRQMTQGLRDIVSHIEQLQSGVWRAEIEPLLQKVDQPPFPGEEWDRAKKEGETVAKKAHADRPRPSPKSRGSRG